jgi:dihydroorotate dehydrogenase (fumarate)
MELLPLLDTPMPKQVSFTPSIQTDICGIKLDSCLMNASGCWCTTESQLNDLVGSAAGAVVSKSSTIEPREGNPRPRFYSDNLVSINSMGIPNLGYEFYLAYGQTISKPFVQSVCPFSLTDLDTMLADLNRVQPVRVVPEEQLRRWAQTRRLVEINLSCPNLVTNPNEYGFEHMELFMDKINQFGNENLICGLKLMPFYEQIHFDQMSRMLLKYDIKFITSINSIPNGLIIDPWTQTTRIYPKNGLGGIGGPVCKPVALANVWNFSKRLGDKIDIIGCGGIESGLDAAEHILCGAKAVQIGTAIMNRTPGYFDVVESELEDYMRTKKYLSLSEFRGGLRVIDSALSQF